VSSTTPVSVTSPSAEPDRGAHTLRGPWLIAARTAWLVLSSAALVLAGAGFLLAVERPTLVGPRRSILR
jgi:hypothetical protein